jgi:hypothetical protein
MKHGLNTDFLKTINLKESMNIQPEENISDSFVGIQLNSGAELKIKAMLFYDEIALAKVNSKKAEAMKLFKGVSTGIGAWGSIEWVLAASVVIGATEAALSAGASSAGARIFEEAIQAGQKLRKEGVFIPIEKIQSIENSLPGLWRFSYPEVIQYEIPQEGILNRGKMETKTKTIQHAFIHNGDEFIVVKTDDGSTCSIRWSAVERYFYSKPTM